MPKWMLGAIIVLGTILALGVSLWATPVEVTTQDQLFLALDQACAKAEQLQTGSRVFCEQAKKRLQEELQKRLQQHGFIRLDPDLLGEVLAWNRSGMDEALQLALGVTEMLDQGAYGAKLHELLAYGRAAGYTPKELTDLVTQLAEMVTAWTPAEDVLDKALQHLDRAMPGESLEEVIEAIKHGTDDAPQDFGTETEDGIPPMGEAKGRAAAEPALNQTPGDDKRGAVEISLPEPADKKQSEHKPEWDQQPPSANGGGMEVVVPPTMDKKQSTDDGAVWGIQSSDDKETEEIEALSPATTDEEENEGASHGSDHRHGGSGKKGKSGKGK